jgi:hypothetical protein
MVLKNNDKKITHNIPCRENNLCYAPINQLKGETCPLLVVTLFCNSLRLEKTCLISSITKYKLGMSNKVTTVANNTPKARETAIGITN